MNAQKKNKTNTKTYLGGIRRRVNCEAQTVNWEAGKEGVAETGAKGGPAKKSKPWIRGK